MNVQLNGIILQVTNSMAKISAMDFFDVNLGLFPTVTIKINPS